MRGPGRRYIFTLHIKTEHMKTKTTEVIIRLAVGLGVVLALVGGYYAYLVNQ